MMASQTISNVFVMAKLAEDFQRRELLKNRGYFIEQIVNQGTRSFRNQCALFILVDEMITRSKTGLPEKRKKTFEIADTLLHAPSPKVMVRSPAADPKEFIEKILDTAEAKAAEDSLLKQSAYDLKKRFIDAVDSFSADVAQQFLASWQEFTRVFLEERLKELKS